jgi:hypothetical protein
MLFIGYLIGFLSRGAITSGDLGSVAAVLWVARPSVRLPPSGRRNTTISSSRPAPPPIGRR